MKKLLFTLVAFILGIGLASAANVYYAGGLNSWSTSDASYKFAADADGTTYTLSLPKLEGEFKIVIDGTWCGGSSFSVGTSINLGWNSGNNFNVKNPLSDVTMTVKGSGTSYTLTVTGTEGTNEYTTVYVYGNYGAGDTWNNPTAGAPMKETSTGVWEATVNFSAATSYFKFKAGSYEYSPGGSDVDVTLGSPITLYQGGGSGALKLSNGGECKVVLNLQKNAEQGTVTITQTGNTSYPETLYVIGNVNGGTWNPTNGYAMQQTSEGVFSVSNISLNDEMGTGNAYFSFASSLSSSDTDWGGMGTRYGSAVQNDCEPSFTAANKIQGGENSFVVPVGVYNITVSLVDMEMTITKGEGEVTPPVPTYPENMYVIGTVDGNGFDPTDGSKMENEGDGFYTIEGISFKANDGFTGFALVSDLAENNDEGGWNYINGLRYGPAENDTEAEEGENEVKKNANSWSIKPGEYNLYFSYDDMILEVELVELYEDQPTPEEPGDWYYYCEGSWFEGKQMEYTGTTESLGDGSTEYVYEITLGNLAANLQFKLFNTATRADGDGNEGLGCGEVNTYTTATDEGGESLQAYVNGGNFYSGETALTDATLTLYYNPTGQSWLNLTGKAATTEPTPDEYYLLGNFDGAANWTLPGEKMTYADGVYVLNDVTLANNSDGNGYFTITKGAQTDWTMGDNRFGPEESNTEITVNATTTTATVTAYAGKDTSWKVPNAVYNVSFNPTTSQVTLTYVASYDAPVVSQSDIYLRGDMTGEDWAINDDYKFTKQDDGTYTLELSSLNGEFKIATEDWNTVNLGGDGNNEDIKYVDAVIGNNTLYKGSTVNLKANALENVKLTLTYTLGEESGILNIAANQGDVVTNWYFVGDYNDYTIEADAQLTANEDGLFTGEFELEGEQGFKITTAGWSEQYGGADKNITNENLSATLVDAAGYGTEAHYDLTSGKYTVTWNASTKEVTFAAVETEEPTPGEAVWAVVGSVFQDGAQSKEMTENEDGTYSVTAAFQPQVFNIQKTEGETVTAYGPAEGNGLLNGVASPAAVTTTTDGATWVVSADFGATGTVLTWTFDPTELTLTVTKEGDEPVTPPTPDAPTTVPTPEQEAEDVLSVFSSAYESAVSFFVGEWSQTTVAKKEQIDGSDVYALTDFNYLGWEFPQGTTIDVSKYDYLHVDYWTPDENTVFGYVPISLEPTKENPIWIAPEVAAGQWNSYDAPLSSFEVDLDKIGQIKFVANVNGAISTPTAYIANVYFWKEASEPDQPEPEVADAYLGVSMDGTPTAPNTEMPLTLVDGNYVGKFEIQPNQYFNVWVKAPIATLSADVEGVSYDVYGPTANTEVVFTNGNASFGSTTFVKDSDFAWYLGNEIACDLTINVDADLTGLTAENNTYIPSVNAIGTLTAGNVETSIVLDDVKDEPLPYVLTSKVPVTLNITEGQLIYEGFQFDVTLPEGCTLTGAVLGENGTAVEFKWIDDDQLYRLIDKTAGTSNDVSTLVTLTIETSYAQLPEPATYNYTVGISGVVFSEDTWDNIDVDGVDGNIQVEVSTKEIPATAIKITKATLMTPSYNTRWTPAQKEMTPYVTEGQMIQLEWSITPENATTKEIVWTTNNDKVTVSADGKISTSGLNLVKELKDVQVTATVKNVDNVSDVYSFQIDPIKLGDANDNDYVTISDVVTIANYIVGKQSQVFDEPNADADDNGEITSNDVTATVNIILGGAEVPGPQNARRKVRAMTNDQLIVDNFKVANDSPFAIGVELNNTHKYASLQTIVTLPEGIELVEVTKGVRAAAHELVYNVRKDGRVNVLLYSDKNATFAEGDGELFNLVVKASDANCGNVTLHRIQASEPSATPYELTFAGGVNNNVETGVEGLVEDGADVRYYTVDGLEIQNPVAGQIVIRVEGGKAEKVVVK